MIAFTEIVGCNGTVVYEAVGNQKNYVTSGRFQVHLAYDGMVLLKLEPFQHSINSSETILYDTTDPQFSLVLYFRKYPNDQWIVKINQNTDAVLSCLEQKCYLKDKHQKYQQPAKQTTQPQKVEKQREVVIENDESEEVKEKSMLIEASRQLNKGLKFTGGLLSKGFESIGGFVASKVPKKEEKKVGENTKQNLKLAANTTKNVLQFASAQVGNLFRLGKKVASDVGDRFESTEKGQEMKANPKYETVKEGARTGVGVLANLYEGVVDAVYSVGSGVSKGAGKIIGARYGEQAGTAADEAMEGAGNAFKIMRVPADQISKNLK